MTHDSMHPATVIEQWLEHLEAGLPGHAAVSDLRALLRSGAQPDPGFRKLSGLLTTALDMHRRLAGGPAATPLPAQVGDTQRWLRTLNAGLTNAVRQLESFIAVQRCLDTGQAWPSFHGWAISPDIGLWLMNRLLTHDYDAVIEFGSGTSTWLLARTMAMRPLDGPGRSRARARPLLSFEHDEAYLASTRQLLATHAAMKPVELVHAPFTAWHEDGQTWRFYDCRAHLMRLARSLARRKARVLVLVDGPPGQTGRHARYPAVPHVFEALGRHRIDLVLDDADRPEEKAVIERWRAYWTTRSIPFQEHVEPSEKGLYIATTQPSSNQGSTP